MVDDCGSSATAASGSVRSRESRCSRVPPISPWDSGQTVMEWSRPVSACAERGSASCRVDPVSTAVPTADPFAFSRALRASSTPACADTHRCTSVPVRRPPGPGLPAAASRTAGLSRSMTSTPRSSASPRSRVDFPTDRGPCRAITGSSSTSRSRIGASRLGSTSFGRSDML